jgi:hypothetical protein
LSSAGLIYPQALPQLFDKKEAPFSSVIHNCVHFGVWKEALCSIQMSIADREAEAEEPDSSANKSNGCLLFLRVHSESDQQRPSLRSRSMAEAA